MAKRKTVPQTCLDQLDGAIVAEGCVPAGSGASGRIPAQAAAEHAVDVPSVVGQAGKKAAAASGETPAPNKEQTEQQEKQAQEKQQEQPAQVNGEAVPKQVDSNGPATHSTEGTQTQPAKVNGEGMKKGAGNVPPIPPGRAALLRRTCVRDRLMATPDWPRVKEVLAQMRADPKLAPMSAEAREQFIWAELDRLYPPLSKAPSRALLDSPKSSNDNDLQDSATRNGGDAGRVKGLGDLPPDWPELPANASLAAEIGWVQANRLYVVEELPSGGTVVRLERAHEPAPSRAAIGWLETSIRSYAKFVEVAAKASSSAADEQDQAKRERLAIEDVRALLAEMLDAAGK